MAYKLLISFTLLVSCNAALLPTLQLGESKLYAPNNDNLERYAPAIYDFAYSVHDSQTGDIKSQQESRRGDVVQGQYSLVEPGGLVRIVDYHADDQTGFNAHVRRQPGNTLGLAIKPASEPSTSLPIASPSLQKPTQKPALLNIHQNQLFGKPTLISAQHSPISLQSTQLVSAQQISGLGLPLALASPAHSLTLAHQSLPIAVHHHQASPFALAPGIASLPTLSQQGLIASPAGPLIYNQGTQPGLFAAAAAPYAISHTAPIAYQNAAPLTHLLTPAALAIHR